MQKLYGTNENEAADILAECTIIHPYGLVGSYLPIGRVSYGAGSANYREVSRQIKTYTEQIAAADVMTEIEAEFQRAECIVFLGFAYHTQNMRLLKPRKLTRLVHVFGTAYRMSDSDTDVVSHQIADFFREELDADKRKQWLKFENKLTAADLFDNYAKSLTGGD